MRKQTQQVAVLLWSIALSWSCGTLVGNPEEDDDDKTPPVSTIVGSPVKFSITDAPVDDAKSVLITVASLSVSLEGQDWIDIPLATATEIDLLQYQDGDALPLAEIETLAAGTYKETRMVLADTPPAKLILNDGTEHELKIPSGTASGIKIKSPFVVIENQPVNLTIDFDLRKSLKKNNGKKGYMMSPVLRLAKNDESGKISGTNVSGTTACAYLAGEAKDATSDCDKAVNSTKVKDGAFTLAFLPVGSYEVRVFGNGEPTDFGPVDVKAGETADVGGE